MPIMRIKDRKIKRQIDRSQPLNKKHIALCLDLLIRLRGDREGTTGRALYDKTTSSCASRP